MRVIAGVLKGRRLKSPTWEGLRPTSDRLRETLFNILAPRVPGARVLDGCAGTGAVGIEALSRGAAHVTFVERDGRAAALVAENLAHCGVAEGYAIIRDSATRAFEALRTLGASRSPGIPWIDGAFDIILLDPPYGEPDVNAMPAMLEAAGNLVRAGGLLVLEHARRRGVPATAGPLALTRDVVSGDSALAFYERG